MFIGILELLISVVADFSLCIVVHSESVFLEFVYKLLQSTSWLFLTSSEAILIFADGGTIHRSLLNGTQHHVLPLKHIQKAKFIEFDPQDSQIYWADVRTKEIWRTDMCGEGKLYAVDMKYL